MHITSIFIPLAILLPNVFFFILKPVDFPTANENSKLTIVLTVVERLGQAGIFILPLFYKFKIINTLDVIALIFMIMSVILYYICWVRYFSKRKYCYLFKPLWIVLIPMAVFPITYMIFSSIIVDSILIFISSVVFAIGHIPISYMEYKKYEC